MEETFYSLLKMLHLQEWDLLTQSIFSTLSSKVVYVQHMNVVVYVGNFLLNETFQTN